MKTTLEVWHGGIPSANTSRIAPSVIERISEAPFGVPWPLFIRHRMSTKPLLVVHVYGGKA